MKTCPGYFSRIVRARYFWMHLVLSDLRTKYRRSFLGIAWAVLNPLFLTILLSFVMGHVFHSSIKEYSPFIFSGLILWEFIMTSAVTRCQSLINAEGYIRQFAQPLAIYTLRSTLTCLIHFSFASMGLLAWCLFISPHHANGAWLNLPLAILFLFIIGWSLATIAALLTVRFRDFTQMIVLLLQTIWYISPIFILPRVFETVGISWIIRYNPVHHLFCLFRLPLLESRMPSLENYTFTAATATIFALCAFVFLKTSEKKVIFYL